MALISSYRARTIHLVTKKNKIHQILQNYAVMLPCVITCKQLSYGCTIIGV